MPLSFTATSQARRSRNLVCASRGSVYYAGHHGPEDLVRLRHQLSQPGVRHGSPEPPAETARGPTLRHPQGSAH